MDDNFKNDLNTYVTGIIKGSAQGDDKAEENNVVAKTAYDSYVIAKAKAVLADLANPSVKESVTESPIKLKGNDVLLNGKSVGKIEHSTDDDKGIKYTDSEGKKKTFPSLPELYKHLGTVHKLKESKEMEKQAELDTEEHFVAKIAELKIELKNSKKEDKEKLQDKIKSYEEELKMLKKKKLLDK